MENLRRRALNHLETKGIEYTLIRHRPVLTITDIQHELLIKPEQMVKTLVLEQNRGTKRFIIAALPGNFLLDWKKLAKKAHTSRKYLSFLEENKIEEVTGLPLGGIMPFGFDSRFSVFFDRSILNNKYVYCSAGIPTESLKIGSKDLLRVSNAQLAFIGKF